LNATKNVTLSSIAEKLKVSKVTVSKALRNHPDISDSMKERVRLLAEELNYRPNRLARNLASRSTRTLGLIVPRVDHHFFSTAVESIYSAAHENEYEIIMMLSQEDGELEKQHLETLLSMKVDGLLISMAEHSLGAQLFEPLSDAAFPIVFFDRVYDSPRFSRVRTNNEEAAHRLVRCALDKDYRRIAFVGGNVRSSIGGARFLGYSRALQEAGIAVDESLLIRSGFSFADGARGLNELLHRGRSPEIVFAATYPVALGVFQAAMEAGLSVPEDLDIISFGDSPYNRFMLPSFTCAHQPADAIGRYAVDQLIHQIEDPAALIVDQVFPVEIIQNHTCIGKKYHA